MEVKKEKGPENDLAELDNHDYFARLRQAHLEKLGEHKKSEEERNRKLARDQASSWRKDGSATYSKVCLRLNELKKLVVPHENFKKTMSLLEQHASRIDSLNSPPHRAQSIIRSVRSELNPRKYSIQTNLICLKSSVLKELLRCYDAKQSPLERKYYHKTNNPLTTARFLFRYYQGFIKVDAEQHSSLKKKRFAYRRAKEKLDKIYLTQKQCEAIDSCKSIQHFHPKGCGNCGVIFIGGQLEGAVPYVKSVSRDTGVFTLVTLAFEIETLKQEQDVQEVLVARLEAELRLAEEVTYAPIRVALQHWWRFVLVYKRLFREHLSLLKSSYRHRIRRLVRMKREVDLRIREAPRLTAEQLLDRFWDIAPALREYVAHANALKDARVLKYARRFQKKLVALVEGARERRYQEWLRLQSLPPPVKPIVIKRLLPPKAERFVCYRAECRGRAFLSKERFAIHMHVHHQHDQRRYAQYAHHAQMKAIRDQEAQVFLTNVQLSKAFLASHSLPADNCGGLAHDHSEGAPAGSEAALVVREVQYTPLEWTSQLHHRFNLYDVFATSRSSSLELVSKHPDLDAPSTIRLDEAMVRIGTHSSCECCIGLRGESLREGKISKIHCLLYQHIQKTAHSPDTSSALSGLTVVDNSSVFGTYVVTLEGARKVPTKITQGVLLTNGALLCIGVVRDGPAILPVVEANDACLVYRLFIS